MSAKLVQRRDVLKGIIKRTLKFTDDIPDDMSSRALKTKLELLETNYTSCFTIHLEVMDLTGSEHIEFQEIEFESIQSMYEETKTRILERISELEESDSDDEADGEQQVQHQQQYRAEVKLPFINIPQFTGDYIVWKSFRDLFLSTIGNRRDLAGAQKLHYLKSLLGGEAAQKVRKFTVSDANYRAAWNLLEARYNNTRLLMNAHFKRLFEQKAVMVESAPLLRELIDTTMECVESLNDLKLPTEHWDAVLVFTVSQRLDSESLKQWEVSLTENEIPSFEQVVAFLEKRCRSLETCASMNTVTEGASSAAASRRTATAAAKPARTSASQRTTIHHASANVFSPCKVCGQGHSVNNCPRFKSMRMNERHDFVKTRGLCFVCLKPGHLSSNCSQSKCATCSGNHNVLLHFGSPQSTASVNPPITAADAAVSSASANTNAVSSQFCAFLQTPVLLPTAVVKVNDSQERVRVLLDTGAVSCLILESCVQRLSLARTRVEVPVSGLGGIDAGTSTSMVQLQIKSCINDAAFPVTALVLQNLTGHLPNRRVNLPLCAQFNHLPLADPNYYEPSNVEMIISSKLVFFVLRDGRRQGSIEQGRETPTLQNSALGWLITGAAASAADGTRSVMRSATMSLHVDVERDLRRFWEIEEVSSANLLTDDERRCEAHFAETHVRDEAGRYVVRIPFSSEPSTQLGSSRASAERRLRHIERRLSAERDLQNQYRSFMQEYAAMGHMRLASGPPTSTAYYLPHHFVVKESSSTTRLRVVFDASAKTTSGRSLNDMQLVGPRLQDELPAIIMRFRRHAVALTADVAKMYRQVGVNESDWDYQRILWRDDPDGDIQEWQLTTVTYDTLRESVEPLQIEDDSPVKILGLLWHPAADCFAFRVNPPVCDVIITKRSILSVVARLFDPLGLLSPSIIVAKMLIQQLWTSGVAWDDEVPETIRNTWKLLNTSLTALERLQFPRWIGMGRGVQLQLHGFADASELAYGGVIYARCEMPDGQVRVSLLTAKTKVAPLKQITVPRLELCAALLLTKLLQSVQGTFDPTTKCVLWSDSQVTLSWIQKAPRSWKTFVANRVSAIQAITPPDCWRYVPTAENPADCLSRGVMPLDLIDHPLWLHGPTWLASNESCWPENVRDGVTKLDERTSVSALVVDCALNECAWMQRFSSLTRLQRVTAWMCHFARNSRRPSSERLPKTFVTVPEMRDALMLCVRRVQSAVYAEEIRCCQRKTDLQRTSKIISLTPFLDNQGVLRVGGRLRHATMTNDEMHPAILPGHDHLTALIIADAHSSLLHGGTQLMLHYIRQRFWIIGARGRIRHYVHKCMRCFRQRPSPGVQQMGDLPRNRVTASRAFSKSGVDYAGPFVYKSRSGRGARAEKGYVALFVCLATKAIHLEFVSDLSSAAFLAAFKRFVARRGKCSEVISDNATNFIGAKRELINIVQSHTDEVARALTDDGIVWRTIPPRSPNFGGLWEAGVKAVKHHLRRIVGQQTLTFEEFATMLAEIEAVLNSRPLCALTDDPHDFTALTPGHFLVGGPPVIVPDRELMSVPMNRLSRWQMVSQLAQHFWRRWRTEYLATLQQRRKWTSTTPNVTVGQLVLLKDELLPPTKWKLARITGTQPGVDGRVRVVSLKHATGETTRAITKICVLPGQSD